MRFNRIVIAVVVIAVAVSCLMVFGSKAIHAQGEMTEPGISNKLDAILINQKAILEGIASIKEELKVIQVRVTR